MKKILKSISMLALLGGMGSSHAALVDFEITGNVLVGDYGATYGLLDGDTITATGTFEDSVLSGGTGTIDFSVGTNTLNIDVNGTLFDQSMDPLATLTLDGGMLDAVTGLNFLATFSGGAPADFNTLGWFFDDLGGMFGEWNPVVTITPSAVPVPAAVWLFGSGLIGLIGVARRKKIQG